MLIQGNHSMDTALFIDIEKFSGASQSNLTVHDSGVDDYYKVVLPDTGLDGDYFALRFPVDVDLDLYVLDAEGNTVVKSTSAENFEDVSFRGLAAGTYYIQVTAPFAAIGEYILSWHFTFNNVAPDDLEGMEPYVITGSTELTNLTISAANAETGVTQEDTFKLTLEQGGNADSKIRFGDYRADWKGLKYILKDGTGETVRDGIGAEISLNGLAAGEYMLTVDTPVEGAYSAYSLSVSLPDPPAKKWTYMVYFASDNNLGTWSMYDLILMQQAVLNPGIDIYVLYDRPSGNDNTQEYATVNGIYRMDSEWDDTRVGKVSYDPGLTVSVNWDESWGTEELDTGSADTLERFVDWVQTQSDADCFGLIMWDHGAENGWLCFDDTPAPGSNEGTNLAISDVADVLKDKDNIPIVIFNNCLLGSELVVTQMTGATDVIVISEPVSFAASTYDYKDFFETITADMTPQEMAEIMVRNAQHQATGINLDPTMLSSVDVRGTELHDALEALADAVAEANNETDIKVLINAMKKAAQDGCLYDASRTQQSDLYDMILQAMADRNYENTSEGFQTALGNLKKAIESVVLDFRSVPADRGYGIAFDNVVHTAMKVLGKGASADKTEEYIKAYLDDFYTSNPAWAGLLFEVGKAYLAENGQSTFRSATFDVTENSDLVKGKTVRVSDLGCFSGQGAVFNGISLIGDYFFHIVITDEKYSTGAFRVANDSGAAVTVSLLSGDGSVVKSGTDSVSFNDLEVGDYYIRLQSEKDCDVTLSFEADWTTGVDRFDYAVTKVNEKNADGNGTPEKATSLSEGYHPGLLTGKGDVDLYRIGNSHAQSYAVVLECTEDVDVAICKGNMKVVKRPRGAYGLYSMQVSSGYYLSVTAKDDQDESKVVNYSLFITENETPEEEIIVISDLVGTPDGVSWGSSVPTAQYNVEFSRDDFANVFLMTTNGRVIDTPELPAGTWQWRVKPNDEYLLTSYDWTVGNEIVSKTDESTPKVVRSNEDGNCEIFFASPNGTWSKLYYAKHVGSLNDEWKGTNEMVSANGKGRIQNLYFGSADMNVLCLTDKENGDAIFLDDVYTERPEEIEEDVARLSRIETILAGAGDDIVDMTSQQFAYIGGDMIIRGGDGDDVIWAGKGSNQLFGDAGNDRIVGSSGRDLIVGGSGNDRMHGGGGNDIFTFCDNWGVDEVEQLDGGSVTLWFKSGDESKWNASELIYTDGDNSVTVKGVTSVTLRFGSEVDGDLYAELCDAKAFDAFSSRTVFDVEPVSYLANA